MLYILDTNCQEKDPQILASNVYYSTVPNV